MDSAQADFWMDSAQADLSKEDAHAEYWQASATREIPTVLKKTMNTMKKKIIKICTIEYKFGYRTHDPYTYN